MFYEDIFLKSKHLKSEILFEVINGLITRESIGTHNTVHGFPFQRGSSVFHTHLDEHPPSSQDIITGLMCTMVYGVECNGVIGPTYVFEYRYSEELMEAFKCSIYTEIEKRQRNINRENNWVRAIKRSISNINKRYMSTCDTTLYCTELKTFGINVSILKRMSCSDGVMNSSGTM